MAPSVERGLAELGKRLSHSPLSKDSLLKLLKQTASSLSEVDQSPTLKSVIGPINDALVHVAIFRHKDKDVRLLVAACFSEIMRILAPDPPYSDDLLKDIFKLFVSVFEELDESTSPYFARRVNILETIAKVRCCVLMLDIGCEDLVLEMFRVFFSVVREDHPPSVPQSMAAIMELIMEESGEISQPLLDVVLRNLLKENKNVSSAARRLSISLVQCCTEKLEPCVQRFLTSVMLEGKAAGSDLQEDYHDIIFEIYQCAPQMLLAVIPNLTQELLTDQVDVRLKAVHLLGRLFALPGQHVAQEYRQLFAEFLKRFSDKTVEVRLAAMECAKECFWANPTGLEATEILSGLKGRLLDFDDKVRVQVVNVICDLAKTNPRWIPSEVVKHVAERLRDKKVSVRKDTLKKLVEVYKAYCLKCFEGFIAPHEQFEWIPSKIIRVCYDKDCKEFRPPGMELVFAENLFPVQLPVDEIAQHWIVMFSVFLPTDIKALERILSQKQRLQQEMHVYLSLRQKAKEDDSTELHKSIQRLLQTMSICFVDPLKAEESFQKLHQMKDNNIFKALTQLLDPDTSSVNARTICDDLLKRIGERHPQHEFMKTLCSKCSYTLFGTDHVKAVLRQCLSNTMASNQMLLAAGIELILKIVSFFPFLVKGSEEELLQLLSEEDELLKERVVQILAKSGRFIRNKLGSVDVTLERLCIDGNRKQAKYAVSAIAALSDDSSFKALTALYNQLVALLEDGKNLPTVLQSIGCIAETAISVFETREDAVIRFVVRKLLRADGGPISYKATGQSDTNFEHPSSECQLKIYGLKVLVKSFLPHKDGHVRHRIKGLLGVLVKMLQIGDISEDIKSSEIDKAHLRLAAAKFVLRLARRWDFHILPQIFHLTILRAQDPSLHVRQQFLAKIHKYLKERTISNKYACSLALAASDADKDIQEDAKKCLGDFIDNYRREAQLRQTSTPPHLEGAALTVYPEYVLVYLVHVLGHHPNFPVGSGAEDSESYEPFYRQLLLFLQALICQNHSGSTKKDDIDNLSAILTIFRAIKRAEDAVDKRITHNLYLLSDIGIIIAKDLGADNVSAGRIPGAVPLPSMFYKLCEGNDDGKTDGSYLPDCLVEGDVLTRFLQGNTPRLTQPSSPHGKRSRKKQEGGSSSEEIEHDIEEASLLQCRMTNDTLLNSVKEQEEGVLHVDHKEKTHNYKQGQNSKSGHNRNESAKSKPQPSRVRSKPKEAAVRSASILGRKRWRTKNVQSMSTTEEISSVHQADHSGSADVQKQPVETDARKDNPGEQASPSNDMVEEENTYCTSDRLDSTGAIPVDTLQDGINTEGELSIQDEIVKSSVMPRSCQKTQICCQSQSSRNDQVDKEHVRDHIQENQANDTERKMATPEILCNKSSPVKEVKSPVWKADKEREGDETLIGKRINVWWPIDRRFCSGTINNFDAVNKTHKIVYDDGEVELLHLASERWELINGSSSFHKGALKFPAKGRKGKQRKLCSSTMKQKTTDCESSEISSLASMKPSVGININNDQTGSILMNENGSGTLTSLSAPKENLVKEMPQPDGNTISEAVHGTGIPFGGERESSLKSASRISDFEGSKRGRKKQVRQSVVDEKRPTSEARVSDDNRQITLRTRRKKVRQ